MKISSPLKQNLSVITSAVMLTDNQGKYWVPINKGYRVFLSEQEVMDGISKYIKKYSVSSIDSNVYFNSKGENVILSTENLSKLVRSVEVVDRVGKTTIVPEDSIKQVVQYVDKYNNIICRSFDTKEKTSITKHLDTFFAKFPSAKKIWCKNNLFDPDNVDDNSDDLACFLAKHAADPKLISKVLVYSENMDYSKVNGYLAQHKKDSSSDIPQKQSFLSKLSCINNESDNSESKEMHDDIISVNDVLALRNNALLSLKTVKFNSDLDIREFHSLMPDMSDVNDLVASCQNYLDDNPQDCLMGLSVEVKI
ncbi:hypothetical protein [Rickettsia sp. TH2014]|uniref:hypothetical protein n=1 Tax=Rickettsia sp. TH2014 TaxID=1967503 RepID=UPI001C48D028|nr:hypothetical protein [Rickettsia sp. TH2014]